MRHIIAACLLLAACSPVELDPEVDTDTDDLNLVQDTEETEFREAGRPASGVYWSKQWSLCNGIDHVWNTDTRNGNWQWNYFNVNRMVNWNLVNPPPGASEVQVSVCPDGILPWGPVLVTVTWGPHPTQYFSTSVNPGNELRISISRTALQGRAPTLNVWNPHGGLRFAATRMRW